MAYMNQEKKKELAPLIKSICKKHGIKATLGVHNYSELVLNIKSGSIDFGTDRINEYWYHEHFADNPKALAFLSEVINLMPKLITFMSVGICQLILVSGINLTF